MNSGPTGARAYDALKQLILSGAFRPGDRLDPAQLAETLMTSTTPVREALSVLTGQRLVEARTSDGYHLPLVDPPALQDLYSWCLDLLLLVLAGARDARPLPASRAGYATAIAELFEALVARSPNLEHAQAIASVNARLHRARLVEEQLLESLQEEMAGLRQCVESGDRRAARAALVRYTRRRVRAAPEIVRAIYRG